MNIELENIKELETKIEKINKIKLDFIKNEIQYTEVYKNMFWKRFYSQKLNLLLREIFYFYNKGELTSLKNPFLRIENRKEVKEYKEEICIQLSNMDINIICSDLVLVKQYEDLKNLIKTNKENYIYDIKFWNLFMEFYNKYKESI